MRQLRSQYRRLYLFDVVASIASIVFVDIAPERWEIIVLVAIVVVIHLLLLGQCTDSLARLERENDHQQLLDMLKTVDS